MKLIGIDYGTKRVGVAVSDVEGRIAFPKMTLPNNSDLMDALFEFAKKEGAERIVLGESKNLSGQDNAVMKSVREFAKKLKEHIDIPVSFEPEFYTSVEARRQLDRHEDVDAHAAAIILTSYLNKINTYDDFS